MKKLNSRLKMLIAMLIIASMLPISIFSYKILGRIYPVTMLELKREFLYLGSSIELTEFNAETNITTLEELKKLPVSVVNNSMILVSSDHPITEQLTFESVCEYKDTDLKLDICMHSAFSELSTYITEHFDQKLFITSAYRTAEEQQALFDEKGSDVAQRPGESEHQTGLSADIAVKGFGGASFLKTDVGKYINLHCWKHGFIIRYPSGKTSVTKIDYEPWHIRYVGIPHAEFISKNDITLEEYIESLTPDILYTYDKISNFAVVKTTENEKIMIPENFISCVISPDNCGNYIITFQLY